mgnify:CR=1 FL=1
MVELSAPEELVDHALVAKVEDALEKVEWWVIISEAWNSLATFFHDVWETVCIEMLKDQVNVLAQFT